MGQLVIFLLCKVSGGMSQVTNSPSVSLTWEGEGTLEVLGPKIFVFFFNLLCSDRYYVILGFVFSSLLIRSLKVFIGISRFF